MWQVEKPFIERIHFIGACAVCLILLLVGIGMVLSYLVDLMDYSVDDGSLKIKEKPDPPVTGGIIVGTGAFVGVCLLIAKLTNAVKDMPPT